MWIKELPTVSGWYWVHGWKIPVKPQEGYSHTWVVWVQVDRDPEGNAMPCYFPEYPDANTRRYFRHERDELGWEFWFFGPLREPEKPLHISDRNGLVIQEKENAG